MLASSGNLLNSRVSDVKVDIPLGRPGQTPHLYVDGAVDSNLKDGIKLLQEAPIPTRKIFAGWEGDGPAGPPEAGYSTGPRRGRQDRGGRGFLHRGRDPEDAQSEAGYERSEGRLPFRPAKGLSAPAVQARVLGSEVRGRIVAEGRGDARTRLLLNGQVAVKSLSDWLGAGQRPLPVSDACRSSSTCCWMARTASCRSIRSQGRRRRPAGAARRPPRRGRPNGG